MKVLTRYLLRAHIGPFLFALVALTGVILINTLAKELANLAGKGLPMAVVLEFFVLSLPANLALTMPMAVLVAVLYTFSSLAAENEITALRASGVDLRRAALPLVLLAALIAGGMIRFNDRVLPAANYRWRVLMTDVAQTSPTLALQAQTLNQIRTNDNITRYYLEARDIETETGSMRGVRIYDVSDPSVTRTITADSGRIAFNSARTDLLLTLHDGDVWEVDFSDPSAFRIVEFRRQMMRMEGVGDEFQRSYGSDYRTDRDMTIGMMRTRIDSLTAQISELRANALAALDSARSATPVEDSAAGSEPVTIESQVEPADTPESGPDATQAPSAASTPAPSIDAPPSGELDRPAPLDNGESSGIEALDGMPAAPVDRLENAAATALAAAADPPTATRRSLDPPGVRSGESGAAVPAMDSLSVAPAPDVGASASAARETDSIAGVAAISDAQDTAGSATAARTSEVPEIDRFTASRINNLEYQIREYRLEIQKKFTIAFATLVFVLIGIPLALRFPRGGIGMVSAFSLAIFGIYYVGLIGGEELSDRGYVPVVLAMWTTNIVFGTLGLIGFLRLGKEQGSGRGSGWGDLPRWMRKPSWPRRRRVAP